MFAAGSRTSMTSRQTSKRPLRMLQPVARDGSNRPWTTTRTRCMPGPRLSYGPSTTASSPLPPGWAMTARWRLARPPHMSSDGLSSLQWRPADTRLSEAKAFGQSTHWVHLASDSDENDVRSLEPLLRAAYDQNG